MSGGVEVVEDLAAPRAALHSRPELSELMERAYVVVAISSPSRPPRSRVEWLVGDWERGAHAIDALVSQGFLREIDGLEAEPRLALGERRWPVHLPGEGGSDSAE